MKQRKTFGEYLRTNADKNEFILRIKNICPNDSVIFYIHPNGQDGETEDYYTFINELVINDLSVQFNAYNKIENAQTFEKVAILNHLRHLINDEKCIFNSSLVKEIIPTHKQLEVFLDEYMQNVGSVNNKDIIRFDVKQGAIWILEEITRRAKKKCSQDGCEQCNNFKIINQILNNQYSLK